MIQWLPLFLLLCAPVFAQAQTMLLDFWDEPLRLFGVANDHHHVDLTLGDACEQLLKTGTLHGAAGEPAVVVLALDGCPAFMELSISH